MRISGEAKDKKQEIFTDSRKGKKPGSDNVTWKKYVNVQAEI